MKYQLPSRWFQAGTVLDLRTKETTPAHAQGSSGRRD
jgi:hypothetical protein